MPTYSKCDCRVRTVDGPPFDDWSKRFSGERVDHLPGCPNAPHATPRTTQEVAEAERAIADLGMA